jgi:hypothetical protein
MDVKWVSHLNKSSTDTFVPVRHWKAVDITQVSNWVQNHGAEQGSNNHRNIKLTTQFQQILPSMFKESTVTKLSTCI